MNFIKGWIGLGIIAILICLPIYWFMDSAKNIAEKLSLEDYIGIIQPDYVKEFAKGAKKDAKINISVPIIKAIKKNSDLEYLGMEERKDGDNIKVYTIGFKSKNNNTGICTILIIASDKKFFSAKSAKLLSVAFIFPDGEIVRNYMQVAEIIYKIVYGGS